MREAKELGSKLNYTLYFSAVEVFLSSAEDRDVRAERV